MSLGRAGSSPVPRTAVIADGWLDPLAAAVVRTISLGEHQRRSRLAREPEPCGRQEQNLFPSPGYPGDAKAGAPEPRDDVLSVSLRVAEEIIALLFPAGYAPAAGVLRIYSILSMGRILGDDWRFVADWLTLLSLSRAGD